MVLAGIICSSCGKDNIEQPDNNTPENTAAGDDSAGQNIETDKIDDDVTKATFDRTVKIVFDGGVASVTGTSEEFTVSIDGAGVTITNKGDEAVIYDLSGSSST
jgi:hypothetical protein